MPAPVTYFEINAKDSKRAREFYETLFGWNINHDPIMNYGMVDTGVKMGINGGISQVQGNSPSNVTFYVQVEDVQGYLDKALAMGARVVMPLTKVSNMVTFALFADFEGNVVGLVKGPQTPPKEAKPKKATAKKKKKTARPKKSAKKRKKK